MGNQLVDFFRHRRQQPGQEAIDWQTKRDEWLRSIDELYSRVEELLADSTKSGDVVIGRSQTQITEGFVGSYTAPVLVISDGNERVDLIPKGFTVVSASGRVDLRGQRDTVTLLRDAGAGEPGWLVVLQRIPKLVTAPLDATTLTTALDRVMLPLP